MLLFSYSSHTVTYDYVYIDNQTFIFVDPPLKATPTETEVISAVNKTAVLECTVRNDDMGNPDSYMFSWSRKTDKEFKVENNGTLILYSSSVDYQDIYYCTPENIAGIGHSAEIQLTIKG